MRAFLFIILVPLLSFAQIKGLDDELEKKLNRTAEDLSTPLKKSFLTDLMNGQTRQLFENYLKENPFAMMSETQVRSLLESILNNQKIGQMLNKNPKVMNFLVKWLHDKEALPSFLSIVNKPKKVKVFGYIILGIFILSFILNLVNSSGGLFKRILYKFFIFIGATTVNLLTFAIMFRHELSPTFRIFKDTIF